MLADALPAKKRGRSYAHHARSSCAASTKNQEARSKNQGAGFPVPSCEIAKHRLAEQGSVPNLFDPFPLQEDCRTSGGRCDLLVA